MNLYVSTSSVHIEINILQEISRYTLTVMSSLDPMGLIISRSINCHCTVTQTQSPEMDIYVLHSTDQIELTTLQEHFMYHGTLILSLCFMDN